MPEMTPEIIDGRKSAAVIAYLTSQTTGPREAYAVLCTCIWILNFKFCDEPISIDQLCEEVEQSLRTLREGGEKHDA